jgi:hypothetical protein
MRKAIWVITAAFLVSGILLVAGCGGSGTSINNTKGSGLTGGVSEAELGVPIYPGAKKQDVRAGMPPGFRAGPQQSGSSGPNWSGQSAVQRPARRRMAALWTPDPVDKVSAWYKEKLSGKTGFREVTPQFRANQSAGGAPALEIFSFKSGDTTKIVMIRPDIQGKGGTTITVREAPLGMPASPPGNQGQ